MLICEQVWGKICGISVRKDGSRRFSLKNGCTLEWPSQNVCIKLVSCVVASIVAKVAFLVWLPKRQIDSVLMEYDFLENLQIFCDHCGTPFGGRSVCSPDIVLPFLLRLSDSFALKIGIFWFRRQFANVLHLEMAFRTFECTLGFKDFCIVS